MKANGIIILMEERKKIWQNGAKYEGEWKEGKKNGLGKMTYLDGKIYEG
jgi:hypothetical protein